MVSTGDPAPEFSLPGVADGERREYRLDDATDGGTVVLAFYLFDFHPTCTEEVCSIRDLEWIELLDDTTVFAVSTDSTYSHEAFAEAHGIRFPLLSDSDGRVARRYDALYEEFDGHRRVARRSVFVVDAGGEVAYDWRAEDPRTMPDWDAVRTAVEAARG